MFTCKEIALALGVAPTAATRKKQKLEQQLTPLLAAMRAAKPQARPCDLAASMASLLDVGGKLVQLDRQRTIAKVRELLEKSAECGVRSAE